MLTQAADTAPLRQNVRLLGDTLGNVIKASAGEKIFAQVEQIRQSSKASLNSDCWEALDQRLASLDEGDILLIARAFSQFLNLANIADQHHTISRATAAQFSAMATLDATLAKLAESASQEAIRDGLAAIKIDLVLTAHPTEITRRTLIHKHVALNQCLAQMENAALSESDRLSVQRRISELVAQIWHTDEFRTERPSPLDEVKWSMAVIENALWEAVPTFLRQIDELCRRHELPLPSPDWCPVAISSWIGGDRDGNPNVTATITQETLLLSQWQACDLLVRDIKNLYEELSINLASSALMEKTGSSAEPYRGMLKPLLLKLQQQRTALERALASEIKAVAPLRVEELLGPVELCLESLQECGLEILAAGSIRDVIRRIHCFGPHLIRLDIRQESGRHTSLMSALTRALELGDYRDWNEADRLKWLRKELLNPRPLIPGHWTLSDADLEVLDTFRVIARTPPTALGCYVISMASAASDILAVQLLMKATECRQLLPVAPLFETLSDLDSAATVIETLLADPSTRAQTGQAMTIMIGYSDSAKDAGMMAAGWAQYRAQENLLSVCDKHGLSLQLFHGRGGTIGRGGAPAHQALLSQPPGSLKNGLRVTEQGEMIRTKLGQPELAVNTLGQYASAILQANLIPPPEPDPAWRSVMDELARSSCDFYRSWVQDEQNFVRYFRQATPEQELANLPLGSRPARRGGGGGLESLRAIPWIFAWTQNRLMLPAWLGAGAALSQLVAEGALPTLQTMAREWPFFSARLSMLEMVFAKSDCSLSAHYDQLLVETELQELGSRLRDQLQSDVSTLLAILGAESLLESNPWGMESIELRNIYTAPLNLLQAELLRRTREMENPQVNQALMVTMAGIAAGMRNTG